MTLYPDQSDFLTRLRISLRSHRAVLGQAATGFGKTQVATVATLNATSRGLRVVFLCHRDILVEQTSATFTAHGIPHSFVAAGKPYNPFAHVHIASVGTLKNRVEKIPEPHLVICDECHHLSARTWRKIFNGWNQAKWLGLTATPWRLDGSGLGEFFTEMVIGPSVEWLIKAGRLSDYDAYAPSAPDLAGVHSRAGDYVHSELEELMDRGALIGDMVAHYRRYACGEKQTTLKRAIYFAVGVSHSQNIAAAFRGAGIAAEHLDAGSSTVERIAAARRFASGETPVITNVDLFGEGYDLASQAGCDVTIEAVGLARPTQSLGLHLQQCGRALRYKNGQRAIILDHAGNLLRHGLPDMERDWTLEARDKKAGRKEVGAAVRQCMSCFGVFAAGKLACPYCGSPVLLESREPEHVDADLDAVDKAAILEAARVERRERGQAKSLEELREFGRRKGYNERWAEHVFNARKAKREKPVDKSYEEMRLW